MPLLSLRPVSPTALLGLWATSETASELLALPAMRHFEAEAATLKSHKRRLEWLATRALLAQMLPHDTPTITHDHRGKPLIEGHHISLSHTQGYAAIIIAKEAEVAIDIERPADRLERLAPRFVRPDETATDNTQRLIIWSAKETMYKYFSADNLEYFDMRIDIVDAHRCIGHHLPAQQSLPITYELTPHYALTFAAADLA